MREVRDLIITGGSGFIGSNFIHYELSKYGNVKITNIDKLTYAGQGDNNCDIEGDDRYEFIQEDICDFDRMKEVIKKGSVVVNFAAETHVDNSIINPFVFEESNVRGVLSLLEASKLNEVALFVQISTDEVYGSLGFDDARSLEGDLLRPSSPYSASKASSEHFCVSYYRTFGLPIIITRSSNNFGPYQFPEKVIPLFATNFIREKKVPLYGDGKNIRNWIYVEDNCRAIDKIVRRGGRIGEVYNIGGENEISNIELTKIILRKFNLDDSMIEYVPDRRGHDRRYSIDDGKIRKEINWKPEYKFDESLDKTIEWYKENEKWWAPLKDKSGKRTN